MAVFLATLHSPLSKSGGIGIIDSEHGLVYLQVDNPPDSTISHQLRGMAYHQDCLYITTPTSVLVYSVVLDLDKPLFELKRKISLPEWLLGPKTQADLLGILISPRRKQLLVANNLFNSVDEFSVDGVFIKRHFLYKIAPLLFAVPETITEPFKYGHIRQIVETGLGTVLLTVSSVNGGDMGCVLNFDTGEILLNDLDKPHGGICYDNQFFVQEMAQGLLSTYPLDQAGMPVNKKSWENKPEIYNPKFSKSIQNMRGMACVDGSIFCGVCHWGATEKEQIPPRIVSFDVNTGEQEATEIFFPDLQEFREPRVFYLAPLSLEIEGLGRDGLSFFLNGERREPVPYLPPITKNDIRVGETPKNDIDTVVPSPQIGINECDTPHRESDENDSSDREPAIILNNVSLAYSRNAISLLSFNKKLRQSFEYQALTDISLTIYEGETVGIIGRNGSGKSTIAMLICGSLPPDKGSLITNGRAQLLSIGLGFRNELSGRENVFLNGALLGLSKKEIVKCLPEIEDFAELGQFMEEPVRTYSAGMRSRLGFAVATAVSPDILILDEIMSTGDAAFRKKADKRMEEMRERTKTIIMVSHSIGQVKKMCSRVIWLHQGKVMRDGVPSAVLPEYESFCEDSQAWLKVNEASLDHRQSSS